MMDLITAATITHYFSCRRHCRSTTSEDDFYRDFGDSVSVRLASRLVSVLSDMQKRHETPQSFDRSRCDGQAARVARP